MPPLSTLLIFDNGSALGEQLVSMLARIGFNIHLACHDLAKASRLKILGTPGQIQLFPLLDFDKESINHAGSSAAIIINLLNPNAFARHKKKMLEAYLFFAEQVARSAWRYKIEHLIQLSSIHATLTAHSNYAKAQALGDKWAIKKAPSSTIIRTDLLLDEAHIHDPFFDVLRDFAAKTSLLFTPSLGDRKIAPLYSGDVARLIVSLIQDKKLRSASYELSGSQSYDLKELLTAYVPEPLCSFKYPKLFMRIDAFFLSLFCTKYNKACFNFCFESKTYHPENASDFHSAHIAATDIRQLFMA